MLRARSQCSAQCLGRISAVRLTSTTTAQPSPPTVPWKTPHSITSWPPEPLIPAAKEGEILMERKPNRELPPYVVVPSHNPPLTSAPAPPPRFSRQVVYSFPFFALAMALAIIGFFNFQKQESSVVSSTLYALRTNPLVRQELGNEIYFASRFPWIRGEINQMRGLIDIEFWVKGTKSSGQVSLKCKRRGRNGYYVTSEWSLTMEDGRVLHLYDPKGDAIDPFMEPTAR